MTRHSLFAALPRRGRVIAAVLGSAVAGHVALGVLAGGAALTAFRVAAAPEPVFPAPARPVAPVVSPRWSTEPVRDNAGEAKTVIAALGPLRDRTVADIGAGEGYYEPHLARAVGPHGRVVAEDIDAATVAKLARRVRPLRNVTTLLGQPDNVALAPASVDVVLMVHMYHEITQPYALLWRLRRSLKGRWARRDRRRRPADRRPRGRRRRCSPANSARSAMPGRANARSAKGRISPCSNPARCQRRLPSAADAGGARRLPLTNDLRAPATGDCTSKQKA